MGCIHTGLLASPFSGSGWTQVRLPPLSWG